MATDTGLEASSTVPAGLVTLWLSVRGKTRRELVVHRVPAGTTPEAVVRAAVGRPISWFQRWSFGGPGVPSDAGGESRATIELRPGRYVLVAYEVDAAGRPGAKFLWRPLTAVAASALIPARFSDPDLTIKLRDSRIEVAGGLRSGQRTIQVENAGGRPHELIVGRLKAGKTVEDVRRWDRDRSDTAPPFTYVGGLTPMSTGMNAQARWVFQTGEHVVLCPMRDGPGRGGDHARGVLATFTVR